MTDTLEKLTDEELNVRLAELLGWKHVGRRATIVPDFPTGYPPTASGLVHMVPRYCQSLDACALVEAGLDDSDLWFKWVENLMDICLQPFARDWRTEPFLTQQSGWKVIALATARQRCIALIATLTEHAKP